MGATVVLRISFIAMMLHVGESTQQDELSLPLLDTMKASLTANIDVSSLNDHIKDFIAREVDKKVKAAIKDTVNKFTNEVNGVKAEMEQTNKDYTTFVYKNFSNLVDANSKQMKESFKSERIKDFAQLREETRQDLQIIRNNLTDLRASKHLCQAGSLEKRVGHEHTEKIQTFTFNPPFKQTPSVVWGFDALDTPWQNNLRIKIQLMELSRFRLKLKLFSWGGLSLWQLSLRWMACPISM